ncbi:HotDog domain-containing protein [Pseudoneurospora amorphoporcata]|uniref:HotDog domain-containing protein n=1 Tax=Pseudoneurospora amorphoporcata TaxID=241081 RepID=A0AAN6SHM7_9PEZI|nr:HotDog domain-containing protein [Pseudoneurospora amorphoporcata]
MRPQTESTATMTSKKSFSTTPKTEQMEIDHFRSIPWVAKHLSQPHVIINQSDTRRPKPGHGDTLISQTLNSQDAISAYITIVQQPVEQGLITEILSFLTLGPQLNGWPGVCHGGIVMTILDEVQGQLFAQNKRQKKMKDIPLMTAYLNTTFSKPVRTPCTIMVRARMTKVEGRKHWTEAAVLLEDEQGKEVELARCDSLFVMLRSNL